MGEMQASRVAFWSACLATVLVAVFGSLLIVGLWIPVGMISLIPIFLLGPTMISLMSGIHHQATADKRVWSQLGLSFAVVYAVLVTVVYYL